MIELVALCLHELTLFIELLPCFLELVIKSVLLITCGHFDALTLIFFESDDFLLVQNIIVYLLELSQENFFHFAEL